MISALRRFRSGLTAVVALSLVVALSPCLTCAQMADDDCCASPRTSIGSACCVNDGSSNTPVPSATVLVAGATPAAAHPAAIDVSVPVPVHTFRVPTRPAVAHAILRI